MRLVFSLVRITHHKRLQRYEFRLVMNLLVGGLQDRRRASTPVCLTTENVQPSPIHQLMSPPSKHTSPLRPSDGSRGGSRGGGGAQILNVDDFLSDDDEGTEIL